MGINVAKVSYMNCNLYDKIKLQLDQLLYTRYLSYISTRSTIEY